MKKISEKLFVSLTEELSRVFGTSYSVRFGDDDYSMHLYSDCMLFSKAFFEVLSHWCNVHKCTFIVDFEDFEFRVFLK